MEGRRVRPPPVDEVNTRPLTLSTKKGTAGTRVTLQANYFRLTNVPDFTLYQYRVDIAPDEATTGARKRLLYEHRQVLPGFVFDGTVLYTDKPLPQPLELRSIKEGNQPVKITVALVGDVVTGDYHYLQIYGIITKKAMSNLQLQTFGRDRKYYDPNAKVEIRDFKLEIWQGYMTSIRQHECGVMLCAEISHKVFRTETLLSLLVDIRNGRLGHDYQREFKNQVLSSTAITDYNNRTYRIDDVDFAVSPKHTFTKDGKNISYVDYYRNKYGIQIKEVGQPLLVSRSRARDRRAGAAEVVYLVPELCRMTGFTDTMRNDYRLMRAVDDHTKIAPQTRIARLRTFHRRLNENPQVVEDFQRWNFQLGADLVEVPARVLPQVPILFGQGREHRLDRQNDWTFALQDRPSFIVGKLTDWIVTVPSKNVKEVRDFISALIRAGQRIGFMISRPHEEILPNDRTETYIGCLQSILKKKNPQMICCVVSNNQLLRYSAIKKLLCIERPILSQVILARTLVQKTPSRLNAVANKVVVQMNGKLGGIPWTVNIDKNMMIAGFDVCHDKREQGNSFGAFVATLDQNYGRYFSAVSSHSSGEELSNDIAVHMCLAVQEYRRHNDNKLPMRIILYRDGVGEGQIPFVHDYEVNQIKKRLAQIYGSMDKVRIAVVVVTKRINTRFFANGNNPAPGTVVDDVVTDPLKYDFFIVSQHVNQGTVSPTAYNVIEDNTGFNPDRMQQLTYKLCHMYFNFSGRIRVPAPCQYAHKLAMLVSQALKCSPNERLNKLLYFL